jgi:renalase
MSTRPEAVHVAVVGAGPSGAACAFGLRQAGAQVTCFEKSTQVGGRMGTGCAARTDATGIRYPGTLDHGAQCFSAVSPRFRSVMARAVAAGCARNWQPRVHSSRLLPVQPCFVTAPGNAALCHHLLADITVRLNTTVRRLQRAAAGTWFLATDGAPLAGPFHDVVLAIPPAQAAVLVAGHHDAWADALMARRMEPCWSLTAVTDDVDWPWDATVPDRGPLAWVLRNDRVPGRTAPRGLAVWSAHATAEWSADHLEAEPQAVSDELQSALKAQLPRATLGKGPTRWHGINVHRWRYAVPAVRFDSSADADEAWWDPSLGLGVCGDFLGGGGVEAAWHSGDELADTMTASFESRFDAAQVASALS